MLIITMYHIILIRYNMVSPNIEYIYIYIYVFYVALTMTAVKDQRALTSTSGGCHGFLHLQIERYI